YAPNSIAPGYMQYEKVWTAAPTADTYSECRDIEVKGSPLKLEYLSGDFNGDGLSDIIAVAAPYYTYTEQIDPYCQSPNPMDCCMLVSRFVNHSNTYLINLDRRTSQSFAGYSGFLNKPYAVGDRL